MRSDGRSNVLKHSGQSHLFVLGAWEAAVRGDGDREVESGPEPGAEDSGDGVASHWSDGSPAG